MKGRTCEAGWRNGWLDIQLNRLGQSSSVQAQDAGLVRILCVAREGAYETLHEPPTAYPHGGWCGPGVRNSLATRLYGALLSATQCVSGAAR